MTELKELDYPEMVAVAASYLDREVPGWGSMVIPEVLDMMDPKLCVAGQLGRGWVPLMSEIEEATGVEMSGVFSASRELWVEEIAARRIETREEVLA